MQITQQNLTSLQNTPSDGLRIYSKFLVLLTLFLIFVGGMVTSTESGLSVPDWPLSYGSLFPPMVGGVFYEHGHRMVASFVGLCVIILAVWLGLKERRRWLKILGFCALATVIVQGLLGGLTVLLMLPDAISVAHGVLAQTFFILTIVIAYSLSKEREKRIVTPWSVYPDLKMCAIVLAILIYTQLILGAVMRHTHSGLAILDFPTMAGHLLPAFNEEMLQAINLMRFDLDLDPVELYQVVLHALHRFVALIIFITVCVFNLLALRYNRLPKTIQRNILLLDILILGQVALGVFTILTLKAPVLTSFHVVTGAACLGMSVLLVLRLTPTSLIKRTSS